MKVDFYLRFRSKFGEHLYITGNSQELGSGDESKALAMEFLNHEFWHASVEVDPSGFDNLQYHYILESVSKEKIHEGEKARRAELSVAHTVIIDTWNHAGEYENAFYTAPFTQVFFRSKKGSKGKKKRSYTHCFRVKAPLLRDGEAVCMLGNIGELGHWEEEKLVELEKDGEWYSAILELHDAVLPVAYKYGVCESGKKKLIRYESGDNRLLEMGNPEKAVMIVHDGFVRLPNSGWKGAGVAIPVFGLRTENGFGVGEFNDIKLLADWAGQTGLKLIQLLPVNDTSARLSWEDSYPYAAISAFALHPIYINLQDVAGKKNGDMVKALNKKKKQLNALSQIDYEQVMQFKMQMLHEIYELEEKHFMKEEEFQNYFAENSHWLIPYAVFSYLRDKNGTPEFQKWKTNQSYDAMEAQKMASGKTKTGSDIRFYYFVQYHLHLQLKSAVDHARKKGIALKGDIPIGIYRYSVDAWTEPLLYHMNWQAGAPPDDFAVKGQNWGFPTYNWFRMQQDHFDWWRRRFKQMSNYFDAFRIDHILGFFRIWSVPLDAVEGILGRFIPALPITETELGEKGIWFDRKRFCKPYITNSIVNEIFGAEAQFVKDHFLNSDTEGVFELKESFNTQQKINSYFEDNENSNGIKEGLFDLVSNVIFLENPGTPGEYHFRISMENTSSFQSLDDQLKTKLRELYIDYFFYRQDDFWKAEALKKLPSLKRATKMLICGEDLGMVPHCVPEVMQGLGILSLEIQRMPKDPKTEFFHPATAPYLSVITPSTHDMSTIRGWWEESREKTQRFFNTVLETQGTAPYFCDSWINRAIILQHLYSPAMWSIFQMQDLLGMSDELRREDPSEERINQPADPKHYWRYRMHLSLEQLLKEKEFNIELSEYISHSGR